MTKLRDELCDDHTCTRRTPVTRRFSQLLGLSMVALAMWMSLGSSASSSTEGKGRRARVAVDDEEGAQRVPESGARGRTSGPGVYEDGLPYCQSGLDCDGTGNRCKDRGDGIKLCMSSNGQVGDACTSGLDCGGGLFCKDRGDGLKQCMGAKKGNQGSFCKSTNDCESGRWCKDRGDGLKVCM